MDSRQKLLRDRFVTVCFAVMASLLVTPQTASAQVRVKKPDRGVYRSPQLTPVTVEYPSDRQTPQSNQDLGEWTRDHETSVSPTAKPRKKLVEVELEDYGVSDRPSYDDPRELTGSNLDVRVEERELPLLQPVHHDDVLRPVNHDDVVLVAPQHEPIIQNGTIHDGTVHNGTWIDAPVIDGPVVLDGAEIWNHGDAIHDATCDGCPSCVAGCDTFGCDSMGSCGTPWNQSFGNSSLHIDSNRWFGGVELLLMWRRGDRLPPLVTTTIDPNPDVETAGELGQRTPTIPPTTPPTTTPLTHVLVGGDSVLGDPSVLGNDRIFDDLRAGGRFTLGAWLDNQQCQSLVMRGWFAGEETFFFATNQAQTPVIARPFLNVPATPQDPFQDAQVIAFPDDRTGSISVQASNDVFGGDLSVRQFWHGKYGGTVDFLYGYQYMRMNEDLNISSTSTSLVDDDPLRPLGSVLAVSDSFDIENEFHGGQIGVSTRYREGCYSFNSLVKVAFGSLARRATLAGSTLTSIDGLNAVEPEGLLVRSTNRGTITDHTFGWVPEIDLSLGWHRYPRFDLTVGYHVIGMTDALQVSGAIDPNLAVSTSTTLVGERPSPALRYNTYYVQGIHFGLQYVY